VHMYRNSYLDSILGSWNDTVNYYDGTPFHSTANSGFLCEWETPVNLVYGTSLKSCSSAIELSNISDQDWDEDGIPNWKEVNSSLNQGYWDLDGTYIPASYANILSLKSTLPGMNNPFDRLHVNPLLISVIPLNSDPENQDSDGDGLLDGKALYTTSGQKVGPKDPQPMAANGPIGIWQAQLEQEESGTIPSELGGWYEYDINTEDTLEWSEIDWISLDVTNSKSVYDFLKKYCCSADLTSGFSKFLMFRVDSEGTVLHSQTSEDIYDFLTQKIKEKYGDTIPKSILDILDDPLFKSFITIEQWQKIFGYNDYFNKIFKHGTNGNMDDEKFYFSDENDDKYVLWVWRGDYISFGSGAEMGIYCDPLTIPGPDLWKSVGFELPMTLNLYNYYTAENVEKIFCWAPNSPQWWITGFNPDFMDVDVTEMAMIGKVDFTGRKEMFDSLKVETEIDDRKSNFIIFDEEELTAWVIWWEK